MSEQTPEQIALCAEIRKHQIGDCDCELMGDCNQRQLVIIADALRAAEQRGRKQARAEMHWPLIFAIERAAWSRSWSQLKQARKDLEARIGKRPHDPLFDAISSSSGEGAR